MELKTGMKLGNKELAEWFGVKYETMKSGTNKKKKLEELKEYCDFIVENNKVIVKEVYEKIYDKNRSKIYKIILKDLPNQIENGKPWTCAQMGSYYYCKYNETLGKKETTYEDNTRKARNNIWGKPKKRYEGGNIIYVYCKMYRGIELKDNDEIIEHAKKLQEKGARNVLVSMAGDGAILVTEDGDVHMGPCPKGEVKNSVGAGDSMVAGFITGYLKSNGNYEEALKMGTAAGSASAFSEDLATGEKIMELYKQL